MDAMKIANGLPMWIACGIPVCMVLIQAITFFKKAYAAGEKVDLTKGQMKEAIRSAAITSIGPSIVVLSGMLSLLITVGGPVAWMRLSLIGSVMFESTAANMGTSAVGVDLGVDKMTPEALTMAIWTMIIGSIGWVLFATFASSRMGKIEKKMSGNNTKLLTMISAAAVIGVFSATSASHLVRLDKNSIACVLGALIMAFMMYLTEKFHMKRLKEWNLTIAILGAMIITVCI